MLLFGHELLSTGQDCLCSWLKVFLSVDTQGICTCDRSLLEITGISR